MCFACSKVYEGVESILSVFLFYLTALLTVMLQEREIRCNTSSAMGNISSDVKECLHVNAAFILHCALLAHGVEYVSLVC